MSLKEQAQEVLATLQRGGYAAPSGRWVDLSRLQEAAVRGTCLYSPRQLAALAEEPVAISGPVRVEVVDATTQTAAHQLAQIGVRPMVLNFASARNPGGGFLNGARAQEEDLCRCSGLYPALLTQEAYYHENRRHPSLLYTDHFIYSPGVPFFRLRSRGERLEQPFAASVLTAPAPNAGPLLRQDPGAGPAILETFLRRWRYVLEVAKDQGERHLVLGAWGCGAFGNQPEHAAETAREVLESGRYGAHFDRLVFAIPSRGRQSRHNLEVFQAVLA